PAIDSTAAPLSFTQVDDGTGQPAKYDVRYAVSPISWGSATSATSGSCATPVAGTAIGSTLTCIVAGLKPSTNYGFQLVAFRGTLNVAAVFGGLSNVATATTSASRSPPPPPPTGSPEPAAGDVVLWQDNFNKTTIADLLAPYPNAGAFSLVTDGHSGQAIRVSYNSSSWNTNVFGKALSETSTDIYFRYWYRLSVGADPTCGGRNWSGFKWFMTQRPAPYPRYTHGVSNIAGGPPGYQNTGLEFTTHDNSSVNEPNPFSENVDKTKRFNTTNDGQCHEYTLHL